MADVFSKAKRSQVMSQIRGRGNKKTEIALARILRCARITGWRRHQPIFGRPDFVFARSKLAVFVDGCFWHGCPEHSNPSSWLKKSSMKESARGKTGRTGKIFWREKLRMNVARDKAVTRTLRRQGWRVIRIWEHDLKKRPEWCIKRITQALEKQSLSERSFSACTRKISARLRSD